MIAGQQPKPIAGPQPSCGQRVGQLVGAHFEVKVSERAGAMHQRHLVRVAARIRCAQVAYNPHRSTFAVAALEFIVTFATVRQDDAPRRRNAEITVFRGVAS
jgi:hypothetical protein